MSRAWTSYLEDAKKMLNIWSLGLYAENVNEWGSFRVYDEFISYILSLISDLNV